MVDDRKHSEAVKAWFTERELVDLSRIEAARVERIDQSGDQAVRRLPGQRAAGLGLAARRADGVVDIDGHDLVQPLAGRKANRPGGAAIT